MESILFIQNIGAGGFIAIIAVILLLFGGKKIPELMKGLGSGIKEFKKAKKDISNEIEDKDEK
jgi:sec-independent protein translocase protein TatA